MSFLQHRVVASTGCHSGSVTARWFRIRANEIRGRDEIRQVGDNRQLAWLLFQRTEPLPTRETGRKRERERERLWKRFNNPLFPWWMPFCFFLRLVRFFNLEEKSRLERQVRRVSSAGNYACSRERCLNFPFVYRFVWRYIVWWCERFILIRS